MKKSINIILYTVFLFCGSNIIVAQSQIYDKIYKDIANSKILLDYAETCKIDTIDILYKIKNDNNNVMSIVINDKYVEDKCDIAKYNNRDTLLKYKRIMFHNYLRYKDSANNNTQTNIDIDSNVNNNNNILVEISTIYDNYVYVEIYKIFKNKNGTIDIMKTYDAVQGYIYIIYKIINNDIKIITYSRCYH